MKIKTVTLLIMITSCCIAIAHTDKKNTAEISDITRKEAADLISNKISYNISRLNEHLTALQRSALYTQSGENYQNLFSSNQNKDNVSKILAIANTSARQQTQQQVIEWLTDLPKQLDPKKKDKQPDLMAYLTTQTVASDTLQAPATAMSYFSPSSKDRKLEDDAFNFDSLFTPTLYTNNEKNTVEKYKRFLFSLYHSETDGLKLDKLRKMINSSASSKKSEYLQRLQEMPAYQKYQLAIRSKIAAESLLLSNIDALISERTPINNDDNVPISPLELTRQKSSRTADATWLHQLKTASPAAIQREQLRVLADIQQALYQNHKINERLLMTITLSTHLALQLSQMSFDLLKKDLNDRINNIVGAQDSNQRNKIKEQINATKRKVSQYQQNTNNYNPDNIDQKI